MLNSYEVFPLRREKINLESANSVKNLPYFNPSIAGEE